MIELENMLAIVAKAREYKDLTDITPKELGSLTRIIEKADKPLEFLNEESLADVEAWIEKHG